MPVLDLMSLVKVDCVKRKHLVTECLALGVNIRVDKDGLVLD